MSVCLDIYITIHIFFYDYNYPCLEAHLDAGPPSQGREEQVSSSVPSPCARTTVLTSPFSAGDWSLSGQIPHSGCSPILYLHIWGGGAALPASCDSFLRLYACMRGRGGRERGGECMEVRAWERYVMWAKIMIRCKYSNKRWYIHTYTHIQTHRYTHSHTCTFMHVCVHYVDNFTKTVHSCSLWNTLTEISVSRVHEISTHLERLQFSIKNEYLSSLLLFLLENHVLVSCN